MAGQLLSGSIYFFEENHAQAEAVLKAAVAQHDTSIQIFITLADFYRSASVPMKPKPSLKKPLPSWIRVVASYIALGNHYRASGQPEAAERAFLDGLDRAPDEERMQFMLGEFYLSQNQSDKAQLYYEKALELKQDFVPAQKRLAHVFLASADTATSGKIVRQLLENTPDDLDALYLQAKMLALKGDFKQALPYFEKVVVRKGEFSPDWRPNDLEYNVGLVYSRNGRFTEAREMLRLIPKDNPFYYPSRVLLADASMRLDDNEKAKEAVEEVLAVDPENIQAGLLMGQVKLNSEDMAEKKAGRQQTISGLEQILGNDPGNLRASILLGQALLGSGDKEKAGRILKKAATQHDTSIAAQLILASFHQTAGQLDVAEAVLKQTRARFDTSMAVRIAEAAFYQTTQRVEQAERLYLAAVESQPEKPLGYLAAGNFYVSMQKPDKGIDYYRKVLKRAPDHAGAQEQLAYQLMMRGQLAEASQMVDQIMEARPTVHASAYLKGRLHLIKGEPLQGVKALEGIPPTFVFRVPQPERPLDYYLGLAYYQVGQFANARQAVRRIGKPWADAPIVRLLDAETSIRLNEGQAALKLAQDVAKEDPENIQAKLIQGLALSLLERYDDALGIYQGIIDKAPDNLSAQYGLGLVYVVMQERDKAYEVYKEILKRDPTAFKALAQITAYHMSRKEPEKALQACEVQLKIVTDSVPMYELHGSLLMAQQRPDDAIVSLKKAVTLKPEALSSHFLLGTLYEQKQDNESAQSHYEKVLEFNPKHGLAANNLAWLYAESGTELERAWSLAEMAREQFPKDPNVMDTLAWVYFKNRSYQRAINLLEDSIDINPRNPIYHYHLGMAQYENGFAREARKSLEKSLELKPKFADTDTVRQILAAWDKKDKPKFDASRIETSNLEGDSFEMK